jgi:electron transport complex protein RnfA
MIAVIVSLGLLSGLSLNLLLQCGIGMGGIVAERERETFIPCIQIGILFVTVLVLWMFFSFIPSLPGFYEYILLFPLSIIFFCILELLVSTGTGKPVRGLFDPVTAYDGLGAAALFITMNTASRLVEAAAMSAGFSLGLLLSLLILREIRRRSQMEAVPRFLRGSPLVLVSMGLLSLVSGASAAIFFRVLGG